MNDVDNSERIGRLETTVEGFHGEFKDIRDTLKSIQVVLARSRETNWSVVFAGLAVCGSLYAAAIRPLNQEIERQAGESGKLAIAVLVKEEKISQLREESVSVRSRIGWLETELQQVREHGSPVMDKRLSMIEMQMQMNKGKGP